MSRTVSDAFGQEAADRLAAIAIDLLCNSPAEISTSTTRVSASLVAEGRAILDDVGIDWRGLVAQRVQAHRERATAIHSAPDELGPDEALGSRGVDAELGQR